jgi:uncharacterized protein (TIGR03382 family)
MFAPRNADGGAVHRLQAAFPQGMCNWSGPGRRQVRVVPWLKFSQPGGTPLGQVPTSRFTAAGRADSGPVAARALPASGTSSDASWLALAVLATVALVRRRRANTGSCAPGQAVARAMS